MAYVIAAGCALGRLKGSAEKHTWGLHLYPSSLPGPQSSMMHLKAKWYHESYHNYIEERDVVFLAQCDTPPAEIPRHYSDYYAKT